MAYPLLLDWYDANRRVLPFRGTRDSYAVWISEIMLQQTRTDTVSGYYTRFLNRFPNIAALAQADEQEVLKYWEGAGLLFPRAQPAQGRADYAAGVRRPLPCRL